MTWVRIDDEFSEHPKVLAAGPLAIAIQIRAKCYSARNLTNGFIPAQALPALLGGFDRLTVDGTPALDIDWPELMMCIRVPGCKAGLWEKAEGGWVIHDYLDYQPSKRQVEEMRRTKSRAGRAGGQARAQARIKQIASTMVESCSMPATPSALADVQANRHTRTRTPIKNSEENNHTIVRGNGPDTTPQEREQFYSDYEQVRRNEWATCTPEQWDARVSSGMEPPKGMQRP